MKDTTRQHKRHIRQRMFLAAFRFCGTVRSSARAAKIARSTHYRWLQDDPEYVEKFRESVLAAGHLLEDVARERAIEGVRQYRFTKDGQPIRHPETGEPYFDLRYSDTLLIFVLKSLLPERYGDRQHLTHAVVDWRDELRQQGIDPDKAVAEVQLALDRAKDDS